MFGSPWVLPTLVVPVLLLVRVWLRGHRGLVVPFDYGGLRPRRWLWTLLSVGESLPPLLLSVAILLLAGPQTLSAPQVKRSLTNIQFCVDVSGSMNASFGEGTRYDASLEAINDFIDYREGDAFGLTFFGNAVLHWVPLTSDVSAFRCAPPFMRPGSTPGWFTGTEIGKALLACRDVLVAREEGDRMIVLVSDGYSADLYGGRDEEVARELRDDGIVVYGIHVAGGEAPGQVVNITRLTGGDVFAVGDPAGLEAVFRRIDEMEPAELEKTAGEYVDWFEPFCIAGLALLGLHLLFQLGLRYTPW